MPARQFLRLNLLWAQTLLRGAESAGVTALETLQPAMEELAGQPGVPLFELARRAGLNALECQIAGLCLAQAIDPGVGDLLAARPGGPADRYVTPGDVARLFFPNDPLAAIEALGLLRGRSALRAGRVVEAGPPSVHGLLATPLTLTSAALAFALGETEASGYFDWQTAASPRGGRGSSYTVVPETARANVLRTVTSFASGFQRGLAAVTRGAAAPLFLLWGERGIGKGRFVEEIAFELFDGLVTLDGEVVSTAPDPYREIRDAFDWAMLRRGALLVRDADALLKTAPAARFLLQCARESPTSVFVTATERALSPRLEPHWALVSHIERPGRAELPALWEAHLPSDVPMGDDVDLFALSERYALTPAAVSRAARATLARVLTRPGAVASMRILEEEAAAQLDTDMGGLVRTIHPTQELDDLVLPDEQRARVGQIVSACRSWHDVLGRWGLGARLASGRCLSCLFHGEPGTGKTYAAEVIASALGKPLHVVSLPNVLSKWLGESERNIQDLFTRARRADAALLFDEADALFSSRVEVTTSQDHSMNMMTGLLLQELDRHVGLVILTSNLTKNIDRAFQRRILYWVEFPMPDAGARERIWQRHLPPTLPTEPGVDVRWLAHSYELSGGEIRSVALRAALAARSEEGSLSQRHLIDSCDQEYRRQGRVCVTRPAARVQP